MRRFLVFTFSQLLVVIASAQTKEEILKGYDDSRVISFPFPPRAFLSLSSSTNQVYTNQCFTVLLEFNVADKNRVPLKFHELGFQVNQLISSSLSLGDCWHSTNLISDIVGVPKQLNDEKYTAYKIMNSAYCPTKSGNLQFPQLELSVMQLNSKREYDKMIVFHSRPVEVSVVPEPTRRSTNFDDQNTLYGEFKVHDFFSATEAEIGVPIGYTIGVSGRGLALSLDPPKIEVPGMTSDLIGMSQTDTIIDDLYFSSKTFKYNVIFNNAQVASLKGKIGFTFYDPGLHKPVVSYTQSNIVVSRSNHSKPASFKKANSKEGLILIDVSRSMMLEDYQPFRLKAVLNGVKEYLISRHDCILGLVAFGKDAALEDVSSHDSCYSGVLLDSIQFKLQKGTSIGDAIMFAKQVINTSVGKKIILIIGDGDNTSGYAIPEVAAKIAKNANIVIFTIGVGHHGRVQFGYDGNGHANLVENTFDDSIFKRISAITGGEYFWAKDSQEVTKIIGQIFK